MILSFGKCLKIGSEAIIYEDNSQTPNDINFGNTKMQSNALYNSKLKYISW